MKNGLEHLKVEITEVMEWLGVNRGDGAEWSRRARLSRAKPALLFGTRAHFPDLVG